MRSLSALSDTRRISRRSRNGGSASSGASGDGDGDGARSTVGVGSRFFASRSAAICALGSSGVLLRRALHRCTITSGGSLPSRFSPYPHRFWFNRTAAVSLSASCSMPTERGRRTPPAGMARARLATRAFDPARDPDATRASDWALMAAVWALCIWVLLREFDT